MENHDKLIYKINNFNALTEEVKRYKDQASLTAKISWIYEHILSFVFLITFIGYYLCKNKAIEYKRKSETCAKARLNLIQQVAFEEKYIKEAANHWHFEFRKIEGSMRRWVEKVREKPKNFSELDNKLLFFVDQFDFDRTTNGLKPYDEVLFYCSAVELYGQIVHKLK